MKISKNQKNIVILIVAAIALAMLHLYIQNSSISLKYEYAKLKVKFQKLYDENRYYSSIVSSNNSLERIEKIAREKIGMIYPEKIVYVIVTKEAK